MANTRKILDPVKLAKMQQIKLLIQNGTTQKEVAATYGIKTRTVSGWVKRYGWKAKYENAALETPTAKKKYRINVDKLDEMRQAKFLLIHKGKTRKEIAQLLGRNARTIHNWVDEFGWMEEAEQLLRGSDGANSFSAFMIWLNNNNPKWVNIVQALHDEFMTSKGLKMPGYHAPVWLIQEAIERESRNDKNKI